MVTPAASTSSPRTSFVEKTIVGATAVDIVTTLDIATVTALATATVPALDILATATHNDLD